MTLDERNDLALRLGSGVLAPDFVDWDALPKDEAEEILRGATAVLNWLRCRPLRVAQRRAMNLLRSLLDDGQRTQVQRSRTFHVVGSTGGLYRLMPHCGHADRVVRHGKRWYADVSYCLHEDDRKIPRADTTIGHLLLLTTDEPAFLAQANACECDQLWNGDYLRHVRGRRKRWLAELAAEGIA